MFTMFRDAHTHGRTHGRTEHFSGVTSGRVRPDPNSNFCEPLWQNFYRPDALPVTQPTASKQRKLNSNIISSCLLTSCEISLFPPPYPPPPLPLSLSGPLSPFNMILYVHCHELQFLQVVLDDVDPYFPLSTSAPLSVDICLQDLLGKVVVFSLLHTSVPYQPGLA